LSGKYIDLTGMVFGRLTVLSLEKRKRIKNGTIIYWLCECSCKEKTKTSVASRDLRNGHTKSCGCYKKEVEKEYLTLEGVTFGIIKVLKRVENTIQPNNTSKIQYLCKCEC